MKKLNNTIKKDEDFVCIIKILNEGVFGEECLGNRDYSVGEDLFL